MPQPLSTVLLDLDGTLIDTAPELAHALDRLCAEQGVPAPAYPAVRATVSHGGARLVQLAFPHVDAAGRAGLLERFLALYQTRLADHEPKIFEGFDEVFSVIASRGLAWGIVTNKPTWLTQPVVDRIHWAVPPRCVVCGDQVPAAKPDPASLLLAASIAQSAAAACVYVGDAERDAQAAHAAGMPMLIASWGYIDEEDLPGEWVAEAMLATPRDLARWLDKSARPALG